MRISRDGFAVYSDNDIREWCIRQMKEAGVAPIPKSRISIIQHHVSLKFNVIEDVTFEDKKTGVVWDIEVDRIQNDDGLDVWY